MKTLRLFILTFSSLVLYVFSFGQAVTPFELSGKYYFLVAKVYFEVDPSFGARISSFKIDNQEILYPSQYAGDYLWGSTFWQSPQNGPGGMGWPPPVTLDQNPYSGGIFGNEIILRSNLDAGSDLIFKKIFSASLSDTSITIEYTMINEGPDELSHAAWEVSRVPSGGISFFPQGEGSVTGAFASQTEIIDGIVWYDHSNSDPGNQKFFSDGLEGWSAHVNEDTSLFVKKFIDAAYDNKAPGENEIELWHNSASTYIELENQGEYTSIPAGDSISWTMKWYARNLPAGIKPEKGNNDLVDFVRKIITQVPPNANSNPSIPKLILYPNPAGEYVSFANLPSENSSLIIFDICGKQRVNKVIKNNEPIQLNGLQNGLYLYQVKGLNLKINGKLIVSK
jgi:hypothetical protein